MLTKIADQIRAEGKAEGENARAREAACRMLDEGLDTELVVRVTGLSREEVVGLRQE